MRSALPPLALCAALAVGCAHSPPPESGDSASREALEEARAELSAATAEMNAAAEQMRELVAELQTLVARAGEDERRADAPAPPPPPPRPRSAEDERLREALEHGIERVGENHYEVDAELFRSVMANPGAVARSMRIVPSIKDGRANGFKVYAIRPNSVAARLGLENGDTIRAINGHDLTTPDEAIRIYRHIRDADELEIAIDRRAEPVTLTLTVQP